MTDEEYRKEIDKKLNDMKDGINYFIKMQNHDMENLTYRLDDHINKEIKTGNWFLDNLPYFFEMCFLLLLILSFCFDIFAGFEAIKKYDKLEKILIENEIIQYKVIESKEIEIKSK